MNTSLKGRHVSYPHANTSLMYYFTSEVWTTSLQETHVSTPMLILNYNNFLQDMDTQQRIVSNPMFFIGVNSLQGKLTGPIAFLVWSSTVHFTY